MSGGSGSGIGSLLTGGLDRSGLSGSGSTLGLLTGGISDLGGGQAAGPSATSNAQRYGFIHRGQLSQAKSKLAKEGGNIDETSRNEFLARIGALESSPSAGSVAELQNILSEIEQVASGTAADPKFRDRKKLAEQRKLQKERPGRRGLLGI